MCFFWDQFKSFYLPHQATNQFHDKFLGKIIYKIVKVVNNINKCRYVRVVKETDSKSVGLCLRRFESCCRRFHFFLISSYFFLFLLIFSYFFFSFVTHVFIYYVSFLYFIIFLLLFLVKKCVSIFFIITKIIKFLLYT